MSSVPTYVDVAGIDNSVASSLGARLVDVGRQGHINADSGLGDCQEGWSIFADQFAR